MSLSTNWIAPSRCNTLTAAGPGSKNFISGYHHMSDTLKEHEFTCALLLSFVEVRGCPLI